MGQTQGGGAKEVRYLQQGSSFSIAIITFGAKDDFSLSLGLFIVTLFNGVADAGLELPKDVSGQNFHPYRLSPNLRLSGALMSKHTWMV